MGFYFNNVFVIAEICLISPIFNLSVMSHLVRSEPESRRILVLIQKSPFYKITWIICKSDEFRNVCDNTLD